MPIVNNTNKSTQTYQNKKQENKFVKYVAKPAAYTIGTGLTTGLSTAAIVDANYLIKIHKRKKQFKKEVEKKIDDYIKMAKICGEPSDAEEAKAFRPVAEMLCESSFTKDLARIKEKEFKMIPKVFRIATLIGSIIGLGFAISSIIINSNKNNTVNNNKQEYGNLKKKIV